MRGGVSSTFLWSLTWRGFVKSVLKFSGRGKNGRTTKKSKVGIYHAGTCSGRICVWDGVRVRADNVVKDFTVGAYEIFKGVLFVVFFHDYGAYCNLGD